MAQCLQVNDFTYRALVSVAKKDKMIEALPHLLAHSENVIHSWDLGISKTFPTIGRPLGPGGNGAGRLTLNTRLNKNRARPESAISRREIGIVRMGGRCEGYPRLLLIYSSPTSCHSAYIMINRLETHRTEYWSAIQWAPLVSPLFSQ